MEMGYDTAIGAGNQPDFMGLFGPTGNRERMLCGAVDAGPAPARPSY